MEEGSSLQKASDGRSGWYLLLWSQLKDLNTVSHSVHLDSGRFGSFVADFDAHPHLSVLPELLWRIDSDFCSAGEPMSKDRRKRLQCFRQRSDPGSNISSFSAHAPSFHRVSYSRNRFSLFSQVEPNASVRMNLNLSSGCEGGRSEVMTPTPPDQELVSLLTLSTWQSDKLCLRNLYPACTVCRSHSI